MSTPTTLKPGDRIKTLRAGRTGSVGKVYADGSACILWDDGTPQEEGLGHERVPGHLLEVVLRYTIGHTLGAPWSVTLAINDADAMTAEELEADMPRIQAALLRQLESIKAERAAQEGRAA